MRFLAVALLVFGLTSPTWTMHQETAPERHEDYPGQSSHTRPPDGWYCSYTAKDEHHCDCHRVPQPGEFCPEAEPDPVECKTYCWAHSKPVYGPDGTVVGMESSHCLCPVDCKMPGHHH